ncbi:MAG: carboxylating nicotinate-nucleotide diphosphorylase [Gemmatimonadales bacterium]|nr:carboxylating nicotinate-nucleotide diphosphorylase [Gemmatimonadales bacterium]
MTRPGDPKPPRRITPLATPAFAPPAAGFPLAQDALVTLVRAALDEDRAFEDVTTIATVVSARHARAALVARADGVVAGVPLALAAFHLLDSHVEIRVDAEDGTPVRRGDTVLFLSGSARGLLSAERVALNFLQRLSGVATLTARYVEAVRGTGTAILDTRKTTPGWRALEKYAVRRGGGVNHRPDLSAAVLIKDNHIAACEGDVALAVQRARTHAPEGMLVQVECDTLLQVREAIRAGVDALLLDNMPDHALSQAVQIAKGKCITEASGGVSLATVRAIAETGVDRISVGALTHSAPSLDLALDFE